MIEPRVPISHHVISLENDSTEVPDSTHWVTRQPSAYSRASCTCGELDTGYIKSAEAAAAAQEHAALYAPADPVDTYRLSTRSGVVGGGQ